MKIVSFLKDSNSFEIVDGLGNKEFIKSNEYEKLHRSICCDQHINFLSEEDYKTIDKIAEIYTENYWRFYYSIG